MQYCHIHLSSDQSITKQLLKFLPLTYTFTDSQKHASFFVIFYTYKEIVALLKLKGGLHSVPGK